MKLKWNKIGLDYGLQVHSKYRLSTVLDDPTLSYKSISRGPICPQYLNHLFGISVPYLFDVNQQLSILHSPKGLGSHKRKVEF